MEASMDVRGGSVEVRGGSVEVVEAPWRPPWTSVEAPWRSPWRSVEASMEVRGSPWRLHGGLHEIISCDVKGYFPIPAFCFVFHRKPIIRSTAIGTTKTQK